MTNNNKNYSYGEESVKEELEILLSHSGMTISLFIDMTFIFILIIIYMLIPGPVNTG